MQSTDTNARTHVLRLGPDTDLTDVRERYASLSDNEPVVLVLDDRRDGAFDWFSSLGASENCIALVLLADPNRAAAWVAAGVGAVLPCPVAADLVDASIDAARRRLEARRDRADYNRALMKALDHVSESVEVTDLDNRFLYVNRAFEELTGYGRDEALGHTPKQLLRSEHHDEIFFRRMAARVLAGEVWQGELISRTKQGDEISQAVIHGASVRDDGSLSHLFATRLSFAAGRESLDSADAPDSTPPRVAQALRRVTYAENRYRAMVDAVGDAILLADMESAYFVEANPAACTLLGYTPAEFRRLTGRMLSPPEAGPTIDRIAHDLITHGYAEEPRLLMLRKDGTQLWASMRIAVTEIAGHSINIAVVRDVTALVEHERALQQSLEQLQTANGNLVEHSRLAQVGRLAASVSHEINNPLQYLDMSLDAALGHLHELPGGDAGDAMKDALSDATEAAYRIAAVSRQLLGFSSPQSNEIDAVDLSAVIESAARMTANAMRYRARARFSLKPVKPIFGDARRLEQQVRDQLLNASHACEGGPAAENTVGVDLWQDDLAVCFAVADTGVGMESEVRQRIFDPFFTTRAHAGGTGLGLAVCAEIVDFHGGRIDIDSTPGVGTRMSVRLPFDNGLAPAAPSVVDIAAVACEKQQSRVLLIDDEPAILRAFQRLLRKQHTVVTAESGRDALDLLAQDRAFDAVICDMMMPDVDGPMVYEWLRDEAPELCQRIAFCTGGTFTERAQSFVGRFGVRVLEKPIAPEDLRAAVERLSQSLLPH